MEAVDEPQVPNTLDVVKANVSNDNTIADVPSNSDLCQKSNGVPESVDIVSTSSEAIETQPLVSTPTAAADSLDAVAMNSSDVAACGLNFPDVAAESVVQGSHCDSAENSNVVVDYDENDKQTVITETVVTEEIPLLDQQPETEIIMDHISQEADIGASVNEKVTFETEVLVEKNDLETNDPKENMNDSSSNILSELGQSIELSDVLRSSDTTESVENNNSGKQAMFNKEELLDILEGNDVVSSDYQVTEVMKPAQIKKELESQIALKQLSRLRGAKVKNIRNTENNKNIKRKRKEKQSVESKVLENIKEIDNTLSSPVNVVQKKEIEEIKSGKPNSENIVNVLVKDWDDDEPAEEETSNEIIEAESSSKLIAIVQESVTGEDMEVSRALADSPTGDNQNVSLNKSGDENQPQRRLGRVIKKKVIFDPDNPDTFTKGKTVAKHKENITEKETPKKIKVEEKARSKSKSPMSKMTWKKPTPKNSNKQNKRLSEVDKLLMDEGAVNMIYQLTPEAPKGRKNMRTKAEFIKKIQSSTPEGKEMKFRERKKELIKFEEEARKITGGKPRTSISGSVKSLSVCEDFETHSADDSIIYRRHSSSSYSSACMSPRRLSDVEAGGARVGAGDSRHAPTPNGDNEKEIFMANTNTPSNEIINKDDCLSIKEKLNTKLSLALKNKRKREGTKGDKPPKQKKLMKAEKISIFKFVSLNIDNNLAEINIESMGATYEVLKELDQVLNLVENMADISVTLLISQNGVLCSDMDLSSLLDNDLERRGHCISDYAESMRSLLCTLEAHSKLLVCGVWGECFGAAVSLVALCDVALAAEDASFAAGPLPLPAAVLAARQLSPALVRDLALLGRRVGAREAESSGLVASLWPRAVPQQVRTIARDLASQPPQGLLLKKRLAGLKYAESRPAFVSMLEKERDLISQYCASEEGQEVLRRALAAPGP